MISFNLGSQQQSLKDSQITQMEPSLGGQTPVPFTLGSQLFSVNQQSLVQMKSSHKVQPSLPINLGSEQLLSTNRQSGLGEPSLKVHTSMSENRGGCQSLTESKQSAQMECSPKVQTAMSSNLGSQQFSSTKKRTTQMELLPKVQTAMFTNAGTQQLLSANKRISKMEQSSKVQIAMPINLGSQQLLSPNKPITPTEPSPKVQTESFESVRSKLRESLAASLALVSDEKSKSQTAGNSYPSETAGTSMQADTSTQPGDSTSIATNAPLCHMSESLSETLISNKRDAVQKCDGGQILSNDIPANENSSEYMQESELKDVSLEDDVAFNNNFGIRDELLQENGLCWASDLHCEGTEAKDDHDSKRPKLAHEEVTGDLRDLACKSPQMLAAKIEEELFRLFGGVNKKYKEKGRSLLFNLKDPKNPELRERVVSGEISPERLCSMTGEELASKALSEWRIAKAEELAQMVVLPDSEVDFRRLVKKNHKGEFQVEVERDDSFSVEFAYGANSISQISRKASETEANIQSKLYNKDARSPSKPNGIEASEGPDLSEKVELGDQNLSNNPTPVTPHPHEKTDFMQEFMVDELKDVEFLPAIVSLDEFMEALDSEPPFENLTVDTVQDTPTCSEKNSVSSDSKVDNVADSSESRFDSALDTLGSKLDPAPDSLGSKLNHAPDSLGTKVNHASEIPGSELDHADVGSTVSVDTVAVDNGKMAIKYMSSDGNLKALASHIKSDSTVSVDTVADDNGKMDIKYMSSDGNLRALASHIKSETCLPDVASKGEHVWEGLIQLNVSSLVTVLGFFKSGEKASTKEWPSFLEIKGRVRLDAFEKFLQEIPLSRSRSIMVVQFCWKEGSPDSGRLNLCETIDSYITDDRVGFAEPCPGVELYLCPPHIKTTQMIGKYLAKEHSETLASTDNGLIGIVVWRKAHVTSTMSPRLSPNHKHSSSSKKQFISRKQSSNLNSTSKPSVLPLPMGPPSANPEPPSVEEPMDDVPPGFGPAATRDEDDLPEFNFVQASTQFSAHNSSQAHPHIRAPTRPVQQMRDLIHKYGQSETRKNLKVNIQPWNDDDDDDDIPEWQPHQDNQPQPPPPPPQFHGFHQQTLQPRLINQHQVQQLPPHQLPPPPPPPLPHAPPLQQLAPLGAALAMPFQSQLGPMHVSQPLPPGMWWSPRGPADVGFPSNGMMVQPCHFGRPLVEGQFYGVPRFVSSQNGMDWRPDFPRSRGA